MGVQEILTFIQEHLGIRPETAVRFFWTAAAVLSAILISGILGRVLRYRVEDIHRRYIGRKTISYITTFLLLIVLVRIWFGGLSGMVAYLGIVSAGLAIALQDPLTNLAGWLFITTRQPFVVGDRVQIGDHTGDVIDIRLLSFSLNEVGNWVAADQSTGRIIHLPNGWAFKQSIANYTQGFNFIWNEIPVVITFESNWEKAKQLLLDAAQRHTAIRSEEAAEQVKRAARKYLIFYQHLEPAVWTSVVDNGVRLTIRYLTAPRRRRTTEQEIWEDILDAFRKEQDIDFAYTTTRFYHNRTEGKPGAGGPPPAAEAP